MVPVAAQGGTENADWVMISEIDLVDLGKLSLPSLRDR